MSHSSNKSADIPAIVLIYDGECPFCRNYVHILRLRNAAGDVRLINARDGGEFVSAARQQGLDLNEGMAMLYAGNWYHGADCMQMLSLMTGPVGLLNTTLARIFRHPGRARLLYPVLRCGRNISLKILGKRKIEP